MPACRNDSRQQYRFKHAFAGRPGGSGVAGSSCSRGDRDLIVVLVRLGKTETVGEPLGGRESPAYLAAGPTGYGRGSGDEVIEASGLAERPRHHPKKKRLHN
jgi:hypothetical protein